MKQLRTEMRWSALFAVVGLAVSLTGCGENSLPALASTTSGSSALSSASTTSGALAFTPSTLSVLPGSTTAITPTGGTAPYTFSVVNAIGTLSVKQGTTSNYIAPGTTGTAVVEAIDSAGATTTLVITVSTTAGAGSSSSSSSSLSVSPAAISVAEGGMVTFSPAGGTPPYTYAVTPAGAGTLSGSVYTAPAIAGTVLVTIVDSAGNTTSSTVTITAPVVTALSCSGNYQVVGTTAHGSMYINEASSGSVSGDIYVLAPGDDDDDDDDDFSLNGTCALIAGQNTIDVKAPQPNYEFQGTYQADPSGMGMDMQGHYGQPGQLVYIWQAIPSGESF